MKETPKNTKEIIIEATMELLREKGNATIKEISERAYVNVAAINYHFGSKDKLIQIIIENVITELRKDIIGEITRFNNEKLAFDGIVSGLIKLIFTFSENNTGLINYSFLQMVTEPQTTNILTDFFLKDQEFTEFVLKQLKLVFPDLSQDHLFSKYLLLFSSFIVPFFLNFVYSQDDIDGKDNVGSYIERYKDYYIYELRKVMTP